MTPSPWKYAGFFTNTALPSPRRPNCRAMAWLVGVAVATISAPLCAATCSLGTQGVSFGSYDFFNSQNLDSVGTVTVTCDVSTSYTVALSPGFGSYASRLMNDGAHRLVYNLYTDATKTIVWGDGSSGSSIVNGSGTTVSYSVYGSIPAGQNAYVGSYSDAITVTLTF